MRQVFLLLAVVLLASSGCVKGDGTFVQSKPAPAPPSPAQPRDVQSPQESFGEEPPLPAPLAVDPAAAMESPGLLFTDSFADVQGAIKRHNGSKLVNEGPRARRLIFPFLGKPKDGTLLLQSMEDSITPGPDGEPGVLAMSWQEIPGSIVYSGFAYLGGNTEETKLTLPRLQAARTAEDLRGLRLKFRFRGLKTNPERRAEIKFVCRLEPNVPDSFSKRLGMGTFVATDAWGVYDAPLTEGDNQETFLKALAEEMLTGFKIIWSQSGSIGNYQPGDTLLIDDVVISQPTAE